MTHNSFMNRSRALTAALCLTTAALATTAAADVVQGTITPATAKVVIKDSAGTQVGTELPAGPYQVKLAAGRFTAECVTPTQKKVTVLSLAQPTTVNIDCS